MLALYEKLVVKNLGLERKDATMTNTILNGHSRASVQLGQRGDPNIA
jgi:hypothetical protein